MSKKQLFNDFQGLSKAEWKEKIEVDLKGKPYLDLCTVNGANINVEPVYTSEDLKINNESPGSGSFRRGSKTSSNDWIIDELFELTENTSQDNKNILNVLNQGLGSLTLSGNLKSGTLKNVLPQYVNLGFSNYSNLSELINELKETFGNIKNDFSIYLNYDPIGQAAINGYWNPKEELELGSNSVKPLTEYSSTRIFTVSGHNYHNAGGNAVSELAFTLAHAHEYLVHLMNNGLSIDEASAQIKIDLAVGGDYFLEIAKVRTFRMLWAKVVESYNPKQNCSKSVIIHSYTSQFLSTLYDPYVNMLRATTQCMSAVLGGCDILRTLPFNTAWKKGDDFSKRIARNVQLLLKEESYFDKVIDPAGGSYYIENMTNELGEKVWEKFKKIEKKGGFIGLVESGNLDRELKEDAQIQLVKLDQGQTKVLGVNLFPNNEDKMLGVLAEAEISEETQKQFKPIELIRLVGKLEETRLEKELEDIK